MTLLTAAQSLGMVELAGVSWINVLSMQERHVARFTIALLLPFGDHTLPAEISSGETRFWLDQARLLESTAPIQDQILELHRSRLLGNLASVQAPAIEGTASSLCIVETHAGSREERMNWMRSVIMMEGRWPIL